MSTIDNGGPAFPTIARKELRGGGPGNTKFEIAIPAHDGMTLRDYFAAKALTSILDPDVGLDGDGPQILARLSYKLADAMIAARTETPAE